MKTDLFDALLAAIPTLTGFSYCKDNQGYFKNCNKLFANAAGLNNTNEIIGKTDFDLPWKESANLINNIETQILTDGQPQSVRHTLKVANENEINFIFHKTPIKDVAGNIIGILSIGSELDDKTKSSEATSNQDQLLALQNILDNMPAHIFWKDRNCILLGCNDLQAKNMGYVSGKEMIGKSNYDVIWHDQPEKERRAQAEAITKVDLEVINKGTTYVAEEPLVLPDGTTAIYLSRKTPLRNKEGNIVGLLGISFDITDRKLAEAREKEALAQATEANAKAKAEQDLRQAVMVLTGSIAHDLRTPISIIDIQGTVLRKYLPTLADAYLQATNNNLSIEDDKPELKSRLKDIADIGDNFKTTARQMNEFIDVTLKSLSKVLSNELTQEDLVTCTMWRCLHNSIERYPFATEEKNLIHKNTSHSFEFMGNEVLIIRVLYNLLKNSLEQIKKQSKGEIFISTEETENANLLRFKDTAGGAPPEVVEYLFDGYRTTKAGGTGVGLAFCKLTMKSFGGDITCNSVYGEFIEFVLSFPKLKSV